MQVTVLMAARGRSSAPAAGAPRVTGSAVNGTGARTRHRHLVTGRQELLDDGVAEPRLISATVPTVDGFANRRGVALALLVALLALFGSAAPAQADAAPGAPGTVTVGMVDIAATTPQAPAPQHSTPDIPLAAGDPAADLTPPAPTAQRSPATTGEQPRAHRQPAADRAPPARQVDL
ncbi:MAG: hypothetical protein GEV28_22725 [Actinophytocola sp.]|uniref:hypothetical protein n=1 Tax=Actinophytocola sp. TaxID=1872138 RepID=UPI001329D9E4|nr:hypothetical protein [Actinophytocola sp.]MPZ83049.1 hypothetical protein [Actinophytocola sp.]